MVGPQMVIFVVVVIMVTMMASNIVYVAPCTRNVLDQQYLLSLHLVIDECSFGMKLDPQLPAGCWERKTLGEEGRGGVTAHPCHGDSPQGRHDCRLLNIHPPSSLLIKSWLCFLWQCAQPNTHVTGSCN